MGIITYMVTIIAKNYMLIITYMVIICTFLTVNDAKIIVKRLRNIQV